MAIQQNILITSNAPKKNTHRPSKEAPNTFFCVPHKNFAPGGGGGPDERGREATARLWLSLSGFMSLLGIGMREPRFLGMPATSGMGFIGPVGSSRVH